LGHFDARNGKLVAVIPWPGSILVMEIGGSIEGCRQEHIVLFAKLKDLFSEQRQVGRNYKVNSLPHSLTSYASGAHDLLDKQKVEQWLPALEFNFYARARTF
jgi:hypothetical protein